jgi:hypothetical protein
MKVNEAKKNEFFDSTWQKMVNSRWLRPSFWNQRNIVCKNPEQGKAAGEGAGCDTRGRARSPEYLAPALAGDSGAFFPLDIRRKLS